MLINFLKGNSLFHLLLVPLLAIVLWLPGGFAESRVLFPFEEISPMPLYGLLSSILGTSLLLQTGSGVVILLLTALILTRINKQYVLIETRSYYLALLLILIVSGYTPLNRLHPSLIGSFFMSLALFRVFQAYSTDRITTYFFDAAFLIGLGSLFYFPLIYLGPFLWISHFIIRPVQLREWLQVAVGLILPYLLAFAIAYLIDQNDALILAIRQNHHLTIGLPVIRLMPILYYTILAIIIVPASIKMIGQLNHKKVSARKYLHVLFWLAASSIVLSIFSSAVSFTIIPVLAIPLSFLLTNYFISIKNLFWGNMILMILILLTIGIHLEHYFLPRNLW